MGGGGEDMQPKTTGRNQTRVSALRTEPPGRRHEDRVYLISTEHGNIADLRAEPRPFKTQRNTSVTPSSPNPLT